MFRTLLQLLVAIPASLPDVLQLPAVRNPIAIAFGAVAGALSRYYLTLWFVERFGVAFPYGTLLINLTGSMAMGFFVPLALNSGIISPEVRLIVAVGFLGSYTTFSTYELETYNLFQQQRFAIAVLYWAGSAILGVLSVLLGTMLARSLLR
ncbi:fluoride efflux transporter CrcB [Lyngbya sp. CCY1209]|jgi:CrcB protein|uniref:fluoride efflux transporter CrcB n=1 Tax=Lyngbya sp. CCY1209 TaxID=2886103 RepID=UPI002D208768|nr:fluoride efflux transporter CrcB [Lyngbya sp. CCY1209]MEB3883221.1 fluoride efflux transporter CrcB [Lyngbya sp. CCY1209]